MKIIKVIHAIIFNKIKAFTTSDTLGIRCYEGLSFGLPRSGHDLCRNVKIF